MKKPYLINQDRFVKKDKKMVLFVVYIAVGFHYALCFGITDAIVIFCFLIEYVAYIIPKLHMAPPNNTSLKKDILFKLLFLPLSATIMAMENDGPF